MGPAITSFANWRSIRRPNRRRPGLEVYHILRTAIRYGRTMARRVLVAHPWCSPSSGCPPSDAITQAAKSASPCAFSTRDTACRFRVRRRLGGRGSGGGGWGLGRWYHASNAKAPRPSPRPRPKTKTQDPRPKTQDPRPRPKTQDPRPKTQDPRPKTQDLRPKTQDPKERPDERLLLP